jgi:type III pantothenate kinase
MIAVDIGNTSLHFYWMSGLRIYKSCQIPTCQANTKKIIKILSLSNDTQLFVCSVVPALTAIFESLKSSPSKKIYIIGKDLTVPIKCFYDRKTIGSDRLVAAFAAKQLYGRTRIIIDFGTAITFDILSKGGDYQGGLILPGIGSTLRVLSSCALLPKKIYLKKPKTLIPRNTAESINKGLDSGFLAMLNSLVDRYKKILKLNQNDKIVVTGGDARFIFKRLQFHCAYEPFLIAKGLALLSNISNTDYTDFKND